MELEFSRAVYHPDCKVAYLFELIGEAPALIPVIYLGFLLAAAVFNRKWFKENKKEQINVFLYVTLTVVATAVVTYALKNVWCRARPREILEGSGGYTPWYVWGNGGSSFPSGHASMSALSPLVADIADRYNVFKRKGVLRALCYLFATFTCVSRVVVGAHFVSDVLCGALIACVVRVVLKRLARACAHYARLNSPNTVL